ncbi:MAG: hypothetical protein M1819_007020 [Sarea resinae]|nr:MAG: hypothetical protein M1819_007020 [Sarea resinae]
MRFLSLFAAAGTVALSIAVPLKHKRVSNFQYFGVDESGAEFGPSNLPGTLGTDYTWPVDSSIDTLVSKGLNIFRVPFLMERLIPNNLTGSLDATYLSSLTSLVNHITNDKSAYAIIDPHNYGRYYSNIITDTAGFQAWWKTVATQFASNTRVLFDTNNEYHDMDQSLVVELNQAAINGIRAAGATSQTILIEGNAWTGAWSWVSSGNGDSLLKLTDPNDNLVYEMHQYLDSDSSGTNAECVNSTIGSSRLQAATQWLQQNGKKGIIGEFAAGNNDVCQSAVKDMLSYLKSNTDVWAGALWWGGGPWWGDYMFNMEPPSGVAYENYLPEILTYI